MIYYSNQIISSLTPARELDSSSGYNFERSLTLFDSVRGANSPHFITGDCI